MPSTTVIGKPPIELADLDGDGDIDVVTTARFGPYAENGQLGIVWYRNEAISNDNGDFDRNSQVDARDVDRICAAVSLKRYDARCDFDNNRRLDIADVSHALTAIYRKTEGDVTFDGIFDSDDMTVVFQAGNFERDDQPALWSTGDWNCDGHFTTSDLVYVFKSATIQMRVSVPTQSLISIVSALHNHCRHGV